MVLKYSDQGTWMYLGGVRKVATLQVDAGEVDSQTTDDLANVIFEKAISAVQDWCFPKTVNHVDGKVALHNEVVSAIGVYMESENDCGMVIVTNQTAYLMNDKGQTIERLV